MTPSAFNAAAFFSGILMLNACTNPGESINLQDLEKEIKSHADEYTGWLSATSDVVCVAEPVDGASEMFKMDTPSALFSVQNIWMAEESPLTPLVGILGMQEGVAHYVRFSRLVVDSSTATLKCGGQPLTEVLFAEPVMSLATSQLSEVETLVTEHQTVTEPLTVVLEAFPYEPELEPEQGL